MRVFEKRKWPLVVKRILHNMMDYFGRKVLNGEMWNTDTEASGGDVRFVCGGQSGRERM